MEVPGPAERLCHRRGVAAQFVVRAAVAAPSVHNTQPWYFVSRPGLICLYADRTRQLACADPAGREMVISCGAALFGMRLAVRSLGFAGDVRLLPDVSHPGLLAEIHWGPYVTPTPGDQRLYRSITRRHTHRGPFTAAVPPLVSGDLVPAVRQEHADLRIIWDPLLHARVGELVQAAEFIQRSDPGCAAETTRWARRPGSPRRDGVPASACPRQPDGLAFAARGFNRGSRWGFPVRSRQGNPRAVGMVALLCTREDSQADWLYAGQALQRMLLEATAQGVSAAFHTQPLELPRTRERLRTGFTDGAYPQMLLRLGRGGRTVTTPRRAVTSVLRQV